MSYETNSIIKFVIGAVVVLATAGASHAEGLSPEEQGLRPEPVLGHPEIPDGRSKYLPKSAALPIDNRSFKDARPQLLTPEPYTAQEHNNRAVECGVKGLWDEALKEHEVALMEEPTNKAFRTNLSGAHLRYGSSLLQKQDCEHAEYQFRRALFVDPNNLQAKQGLDECLKKKAKP